MTNEQLVVNPESREKIKQVAKRIHDRFEENREPLAKAHRRLWESLGVVYEEGHRIGADPGLTTALQDEVNRLPEVMILPQWDARDKSVYENLLVLAEGYDDKESTRSQYLAALKNAELNEVEPKEMVFADWVAKRHGLIRAGKTQAPEEGRKPADVIASFEERLPAPTESDRRIEIDIDVPDGGHLGLLLVQKLPDVPARIIEVITSPRLIASAIDLLERAKQPKPLSPSKIAKLEQKALWHLNRFVLKRARFLRGKPSFSSQMMFISAVQALRSVDVLRDRYFDGEAGFEAITSAHEKVYDFKAINPDFHELDPGRFIKNAKPGVLAPYNLSGITEWDPKDPKTSEACEPIAVYCQSNKKRRLERPMSTAKSLDEIVPFDNDGPPARKVEPVEA